MTSPLKHLRHGYAAATWGVVLFTIYGSWVPFRFHDREPADAWRAWVWVWEHRLFVQSRSDALANIALGIPLGFAVLGWARSNRDGRRGDWIAAAAILPVCLSFAALVEFSQLFFHGRTSSATDVVAQGFGAMLGLFAWLSFGRSLTHTLARAAGDPRSGGAVGRVLLGYLGVLALVQLMPLDFVTSPFGWYQRAKAEYAGGVLFAWPWSLRQNSDHWGRVQTALELAALYVPVGILTAALPQCWAGRWVLVLPAAVLLSLMSEVAQLTVSRSPALNDVSLGVLGVMSAWLLTRRLRSRPTWETTLILGQCWFAILLVIHWQPFDLSAPKPDKIVWIPFAELSAKNTLTFLSDGLERLIAFVPLGVLAVASRRPGRSDFSPRFAAGVGFSVACVLEMGQIVFASRTPGTTELLTGAFGAWLGGSVTRSLLQALRETTST